MKKVKLFVLWGCLAAALAGCSREESTGSAAASAGSCSSASKKEVVEISWMFWDDLEAPTDLMSQGYARVIDRFNEKYAGIYHCTPITTNLEEYEVRLNALISSNRAPDVFICNPGPDLNAVVEAGAAADLTPILNGERLVQQFYEGNF